MSYRSIRNRAAGFLTVILVCTGCEGPKVLTVYNKTQKEIILETKQASSLFDETSKPDASRYKAGTLTYKIPPDSSLNLMAVFSRFLFIPKIKEQDLPIDFLRIQTPSDTVLANSKAEIIRLIKNSKFTYKRKLDKSYASDNNSNFEAIIVRR